MTTSEAESSESTIGDDRVMLAARIDALVDERRRLLRQRRIHLVLLGIAVSLPVHISIMIWLYLSEVEPPPGPPSTAPIVLDLSVLPDETLTEMLESLEAEDLLTPELEVDSGDQSLALEATETLELPKLEIDAAAGGLDSNVGSTGDGLGSGLGSGQGAGTEFFGIRARGRRFAYVVDISGSMGNDGRLATAMTELGRSLSALPDFAEFKVTLYSGGVQFPDFQEGWLRANTRQVGRVREWLGSRAAGGPTNPIPAFEYLFAGRDQAPDTIFFLTDGEIRREIEEEVLLLNDSTGRKPAVINTIAFSQDASQEALRGIAARTEGVFRFVPVSKRRR